MTGLSLTYRIDTHKPERAMHALAAADRRVLLDEIGEQVLSWTLWNFDAEQAPDGEKWKASARAKAEGGKTLQDKGHLRDSYTYLVDIAGEYTEIGSNMVYAAIHHFGGKTKPHVIKARKAKALAFGGRFAKKVNHPGSEMPARPALGLTDEHEREIGELTLEFYRDVMRDAAL